MRINNLDYNNCQTNIANSILKYFNEKPLNNTFEYLDKILEETKPKNVILFLCDGLGYNILKRSLPNNSFLINNNKKVYNCVFPPTTTASTTSLITGLNPSQHGWLGWDNYIAPIDQVVTMYTNKIKDTNVDAGSESVSYKYFNYKTIFDYINESGKYQATYLSPFSLNKYLDIDDLMMKVKGLCNIADKNYIYAYYKNPDEIMHLTGTSSEETISNINMINNKLEELCSDLTDSIVIITADHGHKNSTYFILDDYPKIKECLIRNTSIDSRASMFFIKEDKKEVFKRIFYESFGDYFILMSKEEMLDSELFGPGKKHEFFESSLGDYIAISIADKNIKNNRESDYLVSNHAGNTNDETLVPFIVIDKTK